MSRLPLLSYDDTDPDQRALWDHIIASRGTGAGDNGLDLTTAAGGIAGPFAAFVQRPELGKHLIRVGGEVRFGSSLPDDLLELAITTVGAHWRSEFEFWAHSAMALRAGIDQAIIDALANHEEPVFTSPAEQAVYNYTVALVTNGHVDQPIYDAAVDATSVDGIVDLTHTIGYYTLISFNLNAFEVPLPPGVDSTWANR